MPWPFCEEIVGNEGTSNYHPSIPSINVATNDSSLFKMRSPIFFLFITPGCSPSGRSITSSFQFKFL